MGNALAGVDLEENPEMRCACLLLLDTSGSMDGERIAELNNGLVTFKSELLKDDLARLRVDLGIITFDSEVKVVRDFATADNFEPPVLTAQYQTFMGTAILRGLEFLEERKRQYREKGVPYYRPWLFLITDGHPEGESTDITEQAKRELRKAQEKKSVAVFAVGVGEDVDLKTIGEITGTNALRLKGANFPELFLWLSKSMTRVSSSHSGDDVQLPVPGWASVST
jgi:uncharacterized protein YegL